MRRLIPKYSLIVLVILVLLIPVFQQILKPIRVYDLMGYYEVYPKPLFNDSTWFKKDFQVEFENYMNQNFGFRNIFVRFRNQIEWSLFNKANTESVIVGKQDFLFDRGYLNSYKGRDYIGDSLIKQNTQKLREISDFFDQIETPLLMVIAPGKGWYYPELMPESVSHLNKSLSNYEKYLSELSGSSLHLIDFNAYFIAQKDSLHSLLYPKTGIHWSNFGAVVALDSIIKYSKSKFEINVPEYSITKTDQSTNRAHSGDKDLENIMNLLTRIDNNQLIYPEIEVDIDTKKPKVLFISDSFFHAMTPYVSELFDYQFWYYYSKYWDKDLFEGETLDELKERYQSYDLVVLMCTEAGLKLFPWGFFDDMGPITESIK